MNLRPHFTATTWLGRAVTGRIARRTYAVILILLFIVGVAFRIHTYIFARRFQKVLSGLSTLHIDQTTEEDLQRQVPYLVRTNYERVVKPSIETGDVQTGVLRAYCASYTNRDAWIWFGNRASRFSQATIDKNMRTTSWVVTAADLLGFRYFDFSACVLVFNGKVSRISYGVADDLIFPLAVSDQVSVTSFHSRWGPWHMYAEVPAVADESPAFFLSYEYEGRFSFLYNPNAPDAVRRHLFQVNLNCFWHLFRCDDAREIAPALVHDIDLVNLAAIARINSANSCPDRIIAARARYWPDISVVLAKSLGSHEVAVNEVGHPTIEVQTHYDAVKVLRGGFPSGFQFVTAGPALPNPAYPLKIDRLLATNPGDLVMIFYGPQTCSVIPATPSAIAAFQNTSLEPRRVEDERVTGLQ